MNQLIKNYAMEKYAGDKEAQDAFMDAFEKEAQQMRGGAGGGAGTPAQSRDIMDTLSNGLIGGLGSGLAGMLISGGVMGIGSAAKIVANNKLHERFLRSLETAIANNPILRNADKNKVMSYAETTFKFAPHVATDPNLLSSILANAVHGEGMDPQTIKTLVDLNGRHVDNGAFNPKAYT